MELLCYAVDDPPADIIPGRPERDWMDKFNDRHPYRCLPLSIANTTGWEIQSRVSFRARWNGGPRKEDIVVEPLGRANEDISRFVVSHFTEGVLTFHTGWLFRTPPGWSLYCGGAPNHVKDGIFPLAGIVETDWLPFPFTMNWRFTRPGEIIFEQGEPFCFIFPMQTGAVDSTEPVARPIHEEPELEKEYQTWSRMRSTFLAGLGAKDPEVMRQIWQRFYFKGETPEGDTIKSHVMKRRLKPVKWVGRKKRR
jgi:hypothetical protein